MIEQGIRDEADSWAVPEQLWSRIKASADGAADPVGQLKKPRSWVAAAALVCALVIVGMNINRQSNVSSTDGVASVVAVSYQHLTLPTNHYGDLWVVAVAFTTTTIVATTSN